jgi:hypothetical protein
VLTTKRLTGASEGDRERVLANASLYLDMLGRVVLGWIWLRQGLAAAARLAEDTAPDARGFYRGKLQSCRWYIRNEVSLVAHQCALLDRLEASAFEMQDDWF